MGRERRHSDEDLEAAFGEPPPIITPNDTYDKLVDVEVQLWQANEHLASIDKTVTAIGFMLLVTFLMYVLRVQDTPLWAWLKGLFV